MMLRAATCAICGATFKTISPTKKTCSLPCSRALRAAARDAKRKHTDAELREFRVAHGRKIAAMSRCRPRHKYASDLALGTLAAEKIADAVARAVADECARKGR